MHHIPGCSRIRWFAIVNHSAADSSAAAEWSLTERSLREKGIEIETAFATHRYHAVELTVAAVRKGIRHIIAVGDATTLHEIVNGLFIQQTVPAAAVTLGILSEGGCGIDAVPTTIPEAVTAIASGVVVSHPVATVSYHQSRYRQERMLVAGAGMGLYACLTARLARLREEGTDNNRLHRFLVAVRTVLTYRFPLVRIHADGRLVFTGRVTGAKVTITPQEEPDGSDAARMTVSVTPRTNRMKLLCRTASLLRGTSPDGASSPTFRGNDIRIAAEGRFALEADGHPLGEAPVAFRTTGATVSLAVPAPATDNPKEYEPPRPRKHPLSHPAREIRPPLT